MTEPGGEPQPDHAPEPFAELLTEAQLLFDLDAARAEAWASGLLADWTDHDELLADLRGSDAPAALAVAVALTPMLAAAEAVADELRAAGLTDPAFAPHIGTAAPVDVWTIQDRYGSGTSIVVEYEHDDEVRHDMLVELDGDVAVDLLVGPPGVVEAAAGDETERRFVVETITPADALVRIRDAMRRVLDGADVPLTDAYLLNHALVAARVGLPIDPPAIVAGQVEDVRPFRPSDPEGDELARRTLAAALARRPRTAPPADAIAAAAAAWHAAIAREDPEATALADEVDADPYADDDLGLLVRVAGAYVAPGPRVGMSPAAADAIDALEWADWLGAVLPLVRTGAGADASPDQLVHNINHCPEVTTSIPKRDAPAVASAFAAAMGAWRQSGVVDDELRLTELGALLLPHALDAAWGAEPDAI